MARGSAPVTTVTVTATTPEEIAQLVAEWASQKPTMPRAEFLDRVSRIVRADRIATLASVKRTTRLTPEEHEYIANEVNQHLPRRPPYGTIKMLAMRFGRTPQTIRMIAKAARASR